MSGNDNILKLSSTKDVEDVEMTPIFELDDEVFYVPAKPSAGIGLKYLRVQAEKGPDAAAYYMLVTLLGEEAYETLENHPSLTDEELEQIITLVEGHALGGGDSGKSPAGAKRQRGSKK